MKVTISRKDAEKNIQKKGFQRIKRNGKPHPVFELLDENKNSTGYKISNLNNHKGKAGDFSEKIIRQWSAQLRIMDKEFVYEYVKCTKSQADLLQKMKESGAL